MKWSERQIASFLARVTFSHKHLVIVPNCSWPGAECDLLVVTPNLRIIDVEVKISRADLKADKAKDKWFHGWDWRIDGHDYAPEKRRTREFPRRVWKHYYPGYEKPCNGCGHCCKEEACDLSGEVPQEHSGPLRGPGAPGRALLVRAGWANEVALRELSPYFSYALRLGAGCDAYFGPENVPVSNRA